MRIAHVHRDRPVLAPGQEVAPGAAAQERPLTHLGEGGRQYADRKLDVVDGGCWTATANGRQREDAQHRDAARRPGVGTAAPIAAVPTAAVTSRSPLPQPRS